MVMNPADSASEINALMDQITEAADRVRKLLAQTSSGAAASPAHPAAPTSPAFKASMRRYHANGAFIDLSEVESVLLEKLLENRDHLVTKADLCTALNLNPATQEQNLKSYVFRLKAKLSRLENPDIEIRAIRGAGYCAASAPSVPFDPPTAPASPFNFSPGQRPPTWPHTK